MGRLETNASKLKRRTQSVRRATTKSVADLLQRCADYKIRSAGLVVGSMIDPESIANPHIRAHALEGRLFRTTLKSALEAHGIRCSIFREHDIYATASKSLEQSPERIKRALLDLGCSGNGPWRADQKLAALAAWVLM
jgi:hypothetical protein